MKHIITAFGTLLTLLISLYISVSVFIVSGQTAAAKEYKAEVIAELENSNFNPNVIGSCISQAQVAGYELQINASTYDESNDIQTAEVILSYRYEMPLFGIMDTKTTRGIAR